MPGDLAFGKLQASLAQASQEFTVAAANFNFDFTLVKVEAPPEYRDIATALSPSRVNEAETGPLHATARRLGALFEGVCPKTPSLIKAYGLRASEITREVAAAENQRVRKTRNDNWIRMEYGGIDATSIWAAATSSKAALPVHLLACIIARMWPPAEATSLWAEIIAERKREVLASIEQGDWFHPGIASAVQQEITREQLAKWDSSARAWLQSADSVRQKQYKQFLLIAQNVNAAIHGHEKSLYSNILHVWKTALSAMEGLILGRPHVVREAPVLLGLSAWHIFPDMVAFNSQPGSTTIKMKDALVKEGGILSLGFQDPGPHEPQGVCWSLSLAHHTFYGKPTLQTRRLDSDGSRLTLDEFILVCMGSLLGAWNIPPRETGTVLKIIEAISTTMSTTASAMGDTKVPKFKLSRPFKEFHDGNQQALLAISLGRRRPNFLTPEIIRSRYGPFFALSTLSFLLYLLGNPDNKIQLLRRLASRVPGLNSDNSIILCFSRANGGKDMIFASARPTVPEDSSFETTKKRQPNHHRWIDGRRQWQIKVGAANIINATDDDYESESCLHSLQRLYPHEKVEYLETSEQDVWSTRPWCHNHLDKSVSFSSYRKPYRYMIGQEDNLDTARYPESEHASLYCQGYRTDERCAVPELTFEDILWCFETGLLSSTRLEKVLVLEPAFGFLKVLSAIYATYEDLAACGATISSAIVDRPIHIPILDRLPTKDPKSFMHHDFGFEENRFLNLSCRLNISRNSVISLIGYFETATDIADGVKDGMRIIGLCGGDSIFISSKLINDPTVECSSHSFTRILGNTGHPGFSILTIPKDLRAREVDPAAWRIEPTPFDNTYVDCFKSTSLHLTFTEWRAPLVHVESTGHRGSTVNLVEAVISIRDAGRWVADVDVHAALSSLGCAQILMMSDMDSHKNSGHRVEELGDGAVAVETWDQVLDVPEGTVIVRSSGNWLARLALVSVLSQHSQRQLRPIVIWPSRLCLGCVSTDGDVIHVC